MSDANCFQYMYVYSYDSAFKLVAAGMVDLKPLVTHVIPLADVQKAFDMFIKRTDGAIKVLIDCSKEESKS